MTSRSSIASCYILCGVTKKTYDIRILRDKCVIFPKSWRLGSIHIIKHSKEEMVEVAVGMDRGIVFSEFNGFEPGDIIRAY